jgi:hypothetical protein
MDLTEPVLDRVVILPGGQAKEHEANCIDAIFVTRTLFGSHAAPG